MINQQLTSKETMSQERSLKKELFDFVNAQLNNVSQARQIVKEQLQAVQLKESITNNSHQLRVYLFLTTQLAVLKNKKVKTCI